MNKLILASLLLAVAIIVIIPVAFAEEAMAPLDSCTMKHGLTGSSWTNRGIICPASGTCPLNSTSYTCAICCLADKVYTFTDWIFVAIMLYAVIMLFRGAYNILTSAGVEARVVSGRSYILWALIGLIVALFARALPLALVGLLK